VLEACRPVGDGEEDLPDHVAEEDEVEASRDAREDDEAQRKIGSNVSFLNLNTESPCSTLLRNLAGTDIASFFVISISTHTFFLQYIQYTQNNKIKTCSAK
jgi:hypothetical protein